MTTLHGFAAAPQPIENLRGYLEEVRAGYLEHLRRALAKRAGEGTVELLIERPDPAEPDQIFRLLRPDIVVFEGETARVEVIEGPYALNDVSFDYAGVPLTFHDLAWENCLLSVRGPDPDLLAVATWGALWLDVENERQPAADGLRGAIHSLSRPRRFDGDWSIHVDFGSADVDAILELLEIITVDAESVDVWIPEP